MTRPHASLLAVLLLSACINDSAPGAESKPESRAKPDQPAELGTDGKPLGHARASELIDLRAIINKTPTQVDALLGEPTETGSDRVSCVRFVPERVFFACEQQIRLYAHPKLESIRVEFEDGHAAMVALAGLPEDPNPFDPLAALAVAGLELPGQPRHDNPAVSVGGSQDVIDRWEWGNSSARLRIDGLEHRVRITVVNREWRRAKLEVINNNPLTDEQRARVKPVRGQPPG